MEKLASLKPIHPEIEGFSITAGNSSGVNDGAAAMVVAASDLAEREGLEILATGPELGRRRSAGGRDGPRPDHRDPQGPRAPPGSA